MHLIYPANGEVGLVILLPLQFRCVFTSRIVIIITSRQINVKRSALSLSQIRIMREFFYSYYTLSRDTRAIIARNYKITEMRNYRFKISLGQYRASVMPPHYFRIPNVSTNAVSQLPPRFPRAPQASIIDRRIIQR